MTQERIEKYLKVYVKEVITPRFRRITGDENIEITVDDFRESETVPGVYRLWLGVYPETESIYYHKLTEDIYTFFDMFGIDNLPVIFWTDDDTYVRPKKNAKQ